MFSVIGLCLACAQTIISISVLVAPFGEKGSSLCEHYARHMIFLFVTLLFIPLLSFKRRGFAVLLSISGNCLSFTFRIFAPEFDTFLINRLLLVTR